MSRRLMMTNGGGTIPADGLLFFASFREQLAAETGQKINIGAAALVFDDALGRMVCDIPPDGEGIGISMEGDHLPSGNDPFTMALKVKVYAGGGQDICPLLVWGSTPYGATVAALRYKHGTFAFTAWGNKDVEPVAMYFDRWYHLCGVNDGAGHPKFYVDGRLAATGNFDFGIEGNSFSISSFWSPELSGFRCANVRVYDRALLSGEVAALAKEG